MDSVRRTLTFTPRLARAGRRRRQVALTFDDGPSAPYTRQIVDVLKAAGAAATFFEMGVHVRELPDVTTTVAKAGFPIGDHSDTHPPMARLSTADQRAQIDRSVADIQRVTHVRVELFRPPYGSYDAATEALLRPRHMLNVLWSVDSKDYSKPGVEQIVRNVLGGIRAGAIVLMHDGGGDRSQTVAALPRILHGLKIRGLQAVTIERLLRENPPRRTDPQRLGLPSKG